MEEIQNLSRKERERNFRRNEIISSAIKLFANKGYEHTTLDEIAEASEFGKGTIYNYFSNKEEIYLAIIESILDDHTKMMEELAQSNEDLKSFLTKLTKAGMKKSLENKDAFSLIVRVRTQAAGNDPSIRTGLLKKNMDNNNKILFNKFNDAIKKKEIRPFEINSLINMYRSMIFPYLHFLMCCKNVEDIDSDKEAEFVLSVLFNGIQAN